MEQDDDRYRRLIENSGDIICSLSDEGVFTFVSPAFTRQLGHAQAEVEGRTFTEYVHSADLKACFAFLKKVVETGERQEGVEYRVRDIKGGWLWHTTSAGPARDATGRVIGIDGFSRDITERKRAEEALRESEEKLTAFFASMTEMVILHEVVFDEAGAAVNYRITDCNAAFTRITGICREEAVGKLAHELYGTPEPPCLAEYSRVGISGEPYHYETYFEPMNKHFSISVVSPGTLRKADARC